MWFSNFDQRDGYYWFLVETADKNVAGFSFLNFKTMKSRDVKKKDDEGGHFTAHVAISQNPIGDGIGHLLFVEKVPGVYIASLKDHFTWLCKHENLQKCYVDEKGKTRTLSPVIEIDGYQSGTIREALQRGKLQDIEFVQPVELYEDGLDEPSIVRESLHEAKWFIERKVSDDEATHVFARARDYLIQKFRAAHPSSEAKMYIRIKTEAGQIRRTAVDEHVSDVMEQAFIQNEYVGNFDEPLTQRHEGLREDMVRKIMGLVKKVAPGSGQDG